MLEDFAARHGGIIQCGLHLLRCAHVDCECHAAKGATVLRFLRRYTLLYGLGAPYSDFHLDARPEPVDD